MTRWAAWLVVAGLTLFPAPAVAKNRSAKEAVAQATQSARDPHGQQSGDALDDAFAAINADDPQRALALVQPILAGFEKDLAGEKRHIFCSVTPEEEGYYVTTADGGADNVRLVAGRWCQAQYVRAFALVDLKRLDEAQAAFERLVGYAPKHSRYLNELGYVFLTKKEWQHSIDIYTRAEAAASFTPDRRDEERCVAFRGIGYDLTELGRLDDAEATYRKCLAIIPDEPKSLHEIEYIREQRKKTV